MLQGVFKLSVALSLLAIVECLTATPALRFFDVLGWRQVSEQNRLAAEQRRDCLRCSPLSLLSLAIEFTSVCP